MYMSSTNWVSIHGVVLTSLDLLMPTNEIKISVADAPRMTNRLKTLIKK